MYAVGQSANHFVNCEADIGQRVMHIIVLAFLENQPEVGGSEREIRCKASEGVSFSMNCRPRLEPFWKLPNVLHAFD